MVFIMFLEDLKKALLYEEKSHFFEGNCQIGPQTQGDMSKVKNPSSFLDNGGVVEKCNLMDQKQR